MDIPHSPARRKLLLTQDVGTIRATNNAIFSASLRRISDEAGHLASAPCVLPASP